MIFKRIIEYTCNRLTQPNVPEKEYFMHHKKAGLDNKVILAQRHFPHRGFYWSREFCGTNTVPNYTWSIDQFPLLTFK